MAEPIPPYDAGETKLVGRRGSARLRLAIPARFVSILRQTPAFATRTWSVLIQQPGQGGGGFAPGGLGGGGKIQMP